jgi:hypothetical protein
MSRILLVLSVVMSVVMSIANLSEVRAQAPLPTTFPQSEVSPTAERLAPVVPQWTYERPMQNQSGIVTNTHRYLDSPVDGRHVREHVVTNPRGQMTQTWEQMNTDEGYQYRRSQAWTNPDGTLLRQHERTLSGSDPNNYTREYSHTLPDGRTITQTQVRTWDGTDGTRERSFVGPNGQTRESVRSWTPDEQIAGQLTSLPRPVQASAVAPAPATSQPAEKVRWWQNLNPFRKQGNQVADSAAASAPRRGFTIGTPSSNSATAFTPSAQGHPSVQGSQNTHRPSWAGGVPRSTPLPPAHANGHATAARAAPGRRPNR